MLVSSEAVERSELLQSMPGIPLQLAVPFSQSDVEAWYRYEGPCTSQNIAYVCGVLKVWVHAAAHCSTRAWPIAQRMHLRLHTYPL